MSTSMALQIGMATMGTAAAPAGCGCTSTSPGRSGVRQDRPWQLIHGYVAAVQAAKSDKSQPLFTSIGTVAPLPTEVATAWMREGLYLLNIPRPAPPQYSIGFELDLIATLMGIMDVDTSSMSASHVDAFCPTDANAREIYDR